jgi:hypothetical protein
MCLYCRGSFWSLYTSYVGISHNMTLALPPLFDSYLGWGHVTCSPAWLHVIIDKEHWKLVHFRTTVLAVDERSGLIKRDIFWMHNNIIFITTCTPWSCQKTHAPKALIIRDIYRPEPTLQVYCTGIRNRKQLTTVRYL